MTIKVTSPPTGTCCLSAMWYPYWSVLNCLRNPQVQFSLWLMRYIGTGLLFFIGLKAPGLPRRPYMLLINEDERDVENSGQVLTHKCFEATSGHTVLSAFFTSGLNHNINLWNFFMATIFQIFRRTLILRLYTIWCCVRYLIWISISEPVGQNRREPVYLAGFQKEGPSACSLHVAPRQHLSPAAGHLLFRAAGSWEGY